jgi:hypothetical protein
MKQGVDNKVATVYIPTKTTRRLVALGTFHQTQSTFFRLSACRNYQLIFELECEEMVLR